MRKRFRVLVIHPKSSNTIISVFHDDLCIFKEVVHHHTTFKNNMAALHNEVEIRTSQILKQLSDAGINMSKLDAVSAIGGLIRSVEGGTYIVTEAILNDLKNSFNGKHASNLGGIIAYDIAKGLNIPAYIVDPPVVDEMSHLAKFSGLPEIERISIFHALNQKAVARETARELGTSYENVNLIVAHLGNGITIGAHEKGKVIDVNNGLHGDGPFSLERAGTIPAEALISLCFSGEYTKEDIIHKITYKGGLKAYLNTDNLTKIEEKIAQKDRYAKIVIEAMAYQIAKEIGAKATVLSGDVQGVVLTGDLAQSKLLTDLITERVNWIADVFLFPGEYDLQAVNAGTLRVLNKEEKPKMYTNKGELSL